MTAQRYQQATEYLLSRARNDLAVGDPAQASN